MGAVQTGAESHHRSVEPAYRIRTKDPGRVFEEAQGEGLNVRANIGPGRAAVLETFAGRLAALADPALTVCEFNSWSTPASCISLEKDHFIAS